MSLTEVMFDGVQIHTTGHFGFTQMLHRKRTQIYAENSV